MIKIENVEVVGWEHAIRGMRNPLNSWNKSDSYYHCEIEEDVESCEDCQWCPNPNDKHLVVGKNDFALMSKLASAGTDHRKFMRMIVVYVDVTAPRYWWAEADTYKVGTVRNSCSTMHTIHKKEFTLDDFSHEHLNDGSLNILDMTIYHLNAYRDEFLRTNDKIDWWQIIQLLPSSYNQKATLMLNYEVLANIYHSRKSHHLDEWRDFCAWIETLPYSELITGGESNGI